MTVYVGVDVTEQCRVQLPPGYHFLTRREGDYSLISYCDPLVAELEYATDLKSVV